MDKKTLNNIKGKISGVESIPDTSSVLLYGDSGVGKTTAASLSPKPLIINCEDGTKSLNKFKEYHEQLDIQIMKPDGIQDLRDIFWYLKSGEHDRETVIIDSLTEVQTMSLDEILEDPSRDDKYDEDTATIQDYGKNNTQVRKLIRQFIDLPMNVVFICLAAESKDEETGAVAIQPSLRPKLIVDAKRYVDAVGYMFISGGNSEEKSKRKVLFQPKGKYSAKDRSSGLGMGVEEPTMFHIFNKMTNGSVKVPDNIDKIQKEVQG